jgi:uncharacterized linocin/CFP29 family protein
MHSDLVEYGWTEEHLSRINATVAEEAQRARITAQMLPVVGPEDGSTIAVPRYALGTRPNPDTYADAGGNEVPADRLAVNSDPDLFLTTIAINVPLRSHELADPSLNAALGMFRRAANCIARVEDALVFNGRQPNQAPAGLGQLPLVYRVTGDGILDGLARPLPPNQDPQQKVLTRLISAGGALDGNDIVTAIIEAIGELDARGQQGPYACALSQDLFALLCTPNANLILPRDRVLPFLQGPLLRASALRFQYGIVVALSGNPVEIVVASDIGVRYLQTTLEPRYVFRVSERVALRIREESAIAVLT